MTYAIINRHPGICAACRVTVAAGAGHVFKRDGRWAVACEACFESSIDDLIVAAPAANVTDHVLLSGHVASANQIAVFDHFRYGRGSRIIKAVAGSGKTTTMKNALRYLPQTAHVQLFAFNTKAADQLKAAIAELQGRDEKPYAHVRAGTFHSVGLYAVRRAIEARGHRVDLKPSKLRDLLRVKIEDDAIRSTYGAFATQLVGLARGDGIGALTPDLDEAWFRLVDHHGLYLESIEAKVEDGIALARRLLTWSNEAAELGVIDYDDMLYQVCRWKLRLWRNDVVIVDEAQDTNPVRCAMLHLALKRTGRLYAVGDPKQSIYGFTGATVDAMERIATEFGASELPLTVSYRCGRRIVERAQTWVPYIEPAPTAAEGSVEDDVKLVRALERLEVTDAILCRNTAPLIEVAYGLIARGRACRILGREIGEGLVNLIEQQNARGIDRLVTKLEAWRDREVAKFTARGEEQRAEGVEDRVRCVLVIIDRLTESERTIPGLVARIRGMFADDDGSAQTALTLCTVHKAKGLEWDRVAVLCPELMPSRAARQDWQLEQEYNLMYVAATRARDLLMYCVAGDTAVEQKSG